MLVSNENPPDFASSFPKSFDFLSLFRILRSDFGSRLTDLMPRANGWTRKWSWYIPKKWLEWSYLVLVFWDSHDSGNCTTLNIWKSFFVISFSLLLHFSSFFPCPACTLAEPLLNRLGPLRPISSVRWHLRLWGELPNCRACSPSAKSNIPQRPQRKLKIFGFVARWLWWWEITKMLKGEEIN